MKHFLTKAFEGVRAMTTPITNAYDHACFAAMRAYLDPRFLHIEDDILPHPHLKPVAGVFNQIKGIAQTKLLDSISAKNASGDFSPKPDIKPKLMNLGMNILTHMPRVSPSTVAVTALCVGTGLIGYMLMSHGLQVGQTLPDTLATYLGGKPNAAPVRQNRIG